MGQDVNLIVDVSQEDANTLRTVIEMLLSDWYVGRYNRQAALKGVIDIKDRIEEEKAQKPSNEETDEEITLTIVKGKPDELHKA